VRSACNRRRVPGVEATYVSLWGYLARGTVVLEAVSPADRDVRCTVQTHVP